MTELIAAKRAEIEGLCRKHRVARLDLFGSATGTTFDPDVSDFDFLVSFQPMPPADHADSYFGLAEDLERLLGRPVDLLEREPIRNPYLLEEIERTRRRLYAA